MESTLFDIAFPHVHEVIPSLEEDFVPQADR